MELLGDFNAFAGDDGLFLDNSILEKMMLPHDDIKVLNEHM